MVLFGRKRPAPQQEKECINARGNDAHTDDVCDSVRALDAVTSTASHLEITEHQRATLIDLKKAFSSYAVDPRFGDYFFIRFLRARNFNHDKSKAMLQEYFKWRQGFGVDRIVEYEQYPMANQVKEFYPHGYHGVDRQGRPIYIEQLGKVDVNKVLKITDTRAICEYFVQEYEHLVEVILPCCSMQKGSRVCQTLTVLDLKGLSMLNHFTRQTRQLIKEITGVSQNYYPELLGQMVIINAPTYFTMVWNFVKPLLNEKTVSKIAFGRDKLYDFAAKEQLPEFLGGTQTSTDWYMSRFGPWADRTVMSKVRKLQPHVPTNLYLVAMSPEDVTSLTDSSEHLENEDPAFVSPAIDCATS